MHSSTGVSGPGRLPNALQGRAFCNQTILRPGRGAHKVAPPIAYSSGNSVSRNGDVEADARSAGLGTVEMFADGEPRFVPPPRATTLATIEEAPFNVLRDLAASNSKELRVELQLTNTDLKAKSAELGRAKLSLRMKDKEINELRAALAQRDVMLRASKTDLLETRMALQEKDAELQQAYNFLTSASRERGALREQLCTSQQELLETQAELEHWQQDSHRLKTAIDTTDDENSDVPEDQAEMGTHGVHVDSSSNRAGANGKVVKNSVKPAQVRAKKSENSMEGALAWLKDLTELTRIVMEEAKQDDVIFKKAKVLSKEEENKPFSA